MTPEDSRDNGNQIGDTEAGNGDDHDLPIMENKSWEHRENIPFLAHLVVMGAGSNPGRVGVSNRAERRVQVTLRQVRLALAEHSIHAVCRCDRTCALLPFGS